jgi:hypothetical protein
VSIKETFMDTLLDLYATLDRRATPETVLDLILRLPLLSDQEWTQLKKIQTAARHAQPWNWSSMSSDFWRPATLERPLATAAELFARAVPEGAINTPEVSAPYLATLWHNLGLEDGAQHDFLHGRLNRLGRADAGLELSHRQYNKRYRLLLRLERKRERQIAQLRQRVLLLASKTRLASYLSPEDFCREPSSAAFVAYYSASLSRRSVFSASGQESAFDEVAALLLSICERTPECHWWAVAQVHPTPEVLARLSAEQQGELLGRTYAVLTETAELMEALWARSTFRRDSMVVERGDDSGAWNKLRDLWIGTLWALEAEAVLEEQCPGKVMRLMAADVVFLHQAYGSGSLDPNTAVWAALPLPWQVLSGEVPCSRAQVEAACHAAGLDPVKSGWVGPRQNAQPRPFTPTPELVHGVSVGHPGLALWLRRRGVFSGKG